MEHPKTGLEEDFKVMLTYCTDVQSYDSIIIKVYMLRLSYLR